MEVFNENWNDARNYYGIWSCHHRDTELAKCLYMFNSIISIITEWLQFGSSQNYVAHYAAAHLANKRILDIQ